MESKSATGTISSDYQAALKSYHGNSKWGTTAYKYSGAQISHLLNTRPYIQTALDYGCGKGTLKDHYRACEWSEYDPGIPGKDTKPTGTFDLVTCTDVMEHVERESVEAVIADLAKYTGKVLFVDIACYPTGTVFSGGPYAGQDLHITIREPEWWIAKFDETGLLKHQTSITEKRTKREYRKRVSLIYERV